MKGVCVCACLSVCVRALTRLFVCVFMVMFICVSTHVFVVCVYSASARIHMCARVLLTADLHIPRVIYLLFIVLIVSRQQAWHQALSKHH